MLGLLLGNYRVVRQLAEGGMGVVYAGRHEVLGGQVVVKVLRAELSSQAEIVRRFFNEAQAATAIRNPGIVQVFDFGTTPDGRAYFVMELLEGETLAARLKRHRHDPGECCRLGRQIANVLHAAHAAGITHRDLKPDNLFLVPDSEVVGGERVKVLDFGIAKLAREATTHHGLVMGTLDYMSPEQCRSAAAADARSDIYSLGCILFEMACRRLPFVNTGLDIVAAHLHEPPPPPLSLAPDMPGELAALITRMLAKQPEARPQSMAAVSQVLHEIVCTLGAPPSPTGPPRLLAPPPQVPLPSTTLSGSARVASGAPRGAGRRFPVMLGAIVIVLGAATAIAVVVATGAANPPERVGPSASGATAELAKAMEPSASGGTAELAKAVEPPEVAPPPDIAAECRVAEAVRNWDEMAACARRLAASDPRRSAELVARAAEEARWAPHVAAVEAALRGKDLKAARAELDQIGSQSVAYPAAMRDYAAAESQEIDALAAELERARTADCSAYSGALAKAQATQPPRVAAEAAARVPCTVRSAPPPRSAPRCDAGALAETGRKQFHAGHIPDSLAAYDAAYACQPSQLLLQQAFVVACNLGGAGAPARSYWKRLTPELRARALAICVRNGITPEILDAP